MDKKEGNGSDKITQVQPSAFSIRYLWHLSGRLVPILALFGITILYSHRLSLEDYSLFQSVWMYVNVISVIIGYGISTIIFSTDKNRLVVFVRKNRKIILPLYSALTIAACTLFFFTTGQYDNTLKFWVILFILLQNLNTIIETWTIRNEKQYQYLLINLFYAAFFFLWHLYIVLLPEFHLAQLIAGVCVAAVTKLIALLITRPKLSATATITPSEEKQLVSHWIFAGVNDIFGILSKWVDKLILIYLLTPADFAIFFNGTIDIPLVAMFISITGSYMMMRMTTGQKSSGEISFLFRENFLMISSFSFPLFFFLFFFRNEFFLIFLGEKYLPAVPVFTVSIFILLLRINHFGGILQIHSRSDWVMAGSLLDLIVAIALVFILYPIFGMQGAAAAIIISTLVQIVFYLMKSSQLLGRSVTELFPAKGLFIRLLISGVCFYLLKLLLASASTSTALTIGGAVMCLMIFILGRKYFYQMIKTKQV
ncbi:MAG: polysaccharide biosynthesis C-terminal domain-containing protein [Chitinophagaceae bacterium]|nr:polysaccharide biosynthesis C-terminal domain-containing protein [Chitinophagaceae bacterium]